MTSNIMLFLFSGLLLGPLRIDFKNTFFLGNFKKTRVLALLICLLSTGGCAVTGTIQKANYHKLYPDAQTLFTQLDKSQAIKALQEVIDKSIPDTWSPGTISNISITESGIECVFEITIHHAQKVYTDSNKTVYKKWTTNKPDEHNILKWSEIRCVDVLSVRYVKFGDCWRIYLIGKWDSQSKYHENGLFFSVFTPEERDKAIAALLWLCPEIK